MALDILLSPPDVGLSERRALLAAFDSRWIAPAGPDLDAFEAAMCETLPVTHAVAVSSGTAALHLALRVAGIGPGDVVLIPSLTFAATVNAALYLGASPVLVDSSAATWTIDPDLVAEIFSRQGHAVKALVPVDLYGQAADYDRLSALCAPAGVTVVEDAAEGLGSSYRGRAVGTLGDAAAFSFNGNKIITCGGGGMLVTEDADMAARVRRLANQAREPVAHYEHVTMGYNYRLSNLLAAVGRAQLDQLEDKVRARQRINAAYRRELADVPGLSFMPLADYGESNCWLTCLLVDADAFGATSEDLRLWLADAGIESRRAWKPLHLQPAYEALPMWGGAVSEAVFGTGLCLPSGSALTELEQARVIDAVRRMPRAQRARSA